MGKLTDKQEMFCQEYLVDLNATQAARRAGYSQKSAKQSGTENLSKPAIMARIDELKAKRVERVQIDSDWVLQKAQELHDICIRKEQYGTAARALDIVGKHVDVQAFQENHKHDHEHSGEVGVNTNQIAGAVYHEMIKAERDKRKSESVH